MEIDDLVLAYTDSLTESKDPRGRQLGEKGFIELVRNIDIRYPERFCRDLLDAVAAYRGRQPADDDLTILLLHHNAADPPKQSIGEMIKVIGRMVGLMKV